MIKKHSCWVIAQQCVKLERALHEANEALLEAGREMVKIPQFSNQKVKPAQSIYCFHATLSHA